MRISPRNGQRNAAFSQVFRGCPMSIESSDPPSAELFARYVAGEDEAADVIFARYMGRLTRLARSRLCARLAARVEPEDVVLSAYRSFFVRARAGEFALVRGGDLWRLLAAIALHKVRRQHALHFAARRTVTREAKARPLVVDGPLAVAEAHEPGPDEAAALAEELELCLAALPADQRRVVELRLSGTEVDRIASDIGRTERTVRRILELARSRLEERLGRGPKA